MLLIGLLLVGGAMLLVGFGAFGPNAGRANRRRLDAVKLRYGETSSIEGQYRRISAQRATKLDQTFHRLLPNPDLLRERLLATGKDISLGRFATLCAVLSVVVIGLLAFKGLPLLLALLVGLLVGMGLPHMVVGRMIKRRIAAFLARFPDAIELLVRGLRSGLPITETITVIGSEVPDPVGCEFRAVSDRMRIGRTMEQALQETGSKLNTPEFQFFIITLSIQRETGGNLAETLGNLADVLRKRMQMRLKIKAMSSESKASAYIIGVLPFVVFGIIYFMNPEYMGKFFTDTRLMIAAAGGAVWMSIGAFIMAKMINFEI